MARYYNEFPTRGFYCWISDESGRVLFWNRRESVYTTNWSPACIFPTWRGANAVDHANAKKKFWTDAPDQWPRSHGWCVQSSGTPFDRMHRAPLDGSTHAT